MYSFLSKVYVCKAIYNSCLEVREFVQEIDADIAHTNDENTLASANIIWLTTIADI